jgi:hypothetical protein
MEAVTTTTAVTVIMEVTAVTTFAAAHVRRGPWSPGAASLGARIRARNFRVLPAGGSPPPLPARAFFVPMQIWPDEFLARAY